MRGRDRRVLEAYGPAALACAVLSRRETVLHKMEGETYILWRVHATPLPQHMKSYEASYGKFPNWKCLLFWKTNYISCSVAPATEDSEKSRRARSISTCAFTSSCNLHYPFSTQPSISWESENDKSRSLIYGEKKIDGSY